MTRSLSHALECTISGHQDHLFNEATLKALTHVLEDIQKFHSQGPAEGSVHPGTSFVWQRCRRIDACWAYANGRFTRVGIRFTFQSEYRDMPVGGNHNLFQILRVQIFSW